MSSSLADARTTGVMTAEKASIPLTSRERALLVVLAEDGGFTTSSVAKLTSEHVLAGWEARSRSQVIRHDLAHMHCRGLVAKLDAAKPVCWVRTARGTAALAEQEST